MHIYSPVLFKLDGALEYLLWFTNEADGVYTDPFGCVPVFSRLDDLERYAKQHGLRLEPGDPSVHDLDAVRVWLARPLPAGIDCDALITAWNLFDDVLASTEGRKLRDEGAYNRVYKRMFAGLNLPVFTPPGEKWAPRWRHHEARKLRDTLREGLAVFRRYRRLVTPAKIESAVAAGAFDR